MKRIVSSFGHYDLLSFCVWGRAYLKVVVSSIFKQVLGRINGCYAAAHKTQSIVIIPCRGNVFTELLSNTGRKDKTEPLRSNDKRDTYTDTQTDGRDLWARPMNWVQVPRYTYRVSYQ
jgi:hypothetical protein